MYWVIQYYTFAMKYKSTHPPTKKYGSKKKKGILYIFKILIRSETFHCCSRNNKKLFWNNGPLLREKEGDLTQAYDKTPLYQQKIRKQKDNT